jgi:hypothetical protein
VNNQSLPDKKKSWCTYSNFCLAIPTHGFLKISEFCQEKEMNGGVRNRVARWFIFRPKIQILVNFGEP